MHFTFPDKWFLGGLGGEAKPLYLNEKEWEEPDIEPEYKSDLE